MKRAVAYCRVSTDKDDQKNSLDNQKQFFKDYIKSKGKWKFVDIYVDEGITGTSTKKRKAFKQMIADGEAGHFDLVLTKEISRFARNTLDSIYYTRLLKSNKIGVYFINDNINTLDPDSELRLTIMASIAQEESRKTSERVRWGQKRQMEKGVVFGVKVYGYDIVNGKLIINEEEAEVVRLIYFKYIVEGKGVGRIARDLDEMAIPTPTRIRNWTHASLLRILKNEKYMGTLKQKKQITLDYLKQKRKRNEGEEEFIILENNHPPIIEKELFLQAQAELQKRNKRLHVDKIRYSNRYPFSGKILCGHCGTTFKRRITNAKSKNPKIVWECGVSTRHGRLKVNRAGNQIGCDNKNINEKILENVFLSALKDFIIDRQNIIKSIEDALKKALNQNEGEPGQIAKLKAFIERIQAKKKKLVELYMDSMISKEEFQSISADIERQIESKKKEIEKFELICSQQNNFNSMMDSIRANIEAIVSLEEFSGEVCRTVLDSIKVHGRDSMECYISDIPFS